MAGPFYFAWVDATATTWDLAYKREDEDVFQLSVTQNEGDFATLEASIKNPRVGLLCATRKQWCWLSYEKNSVVTPLFFGRLVGIPSDVNKSLVSLVFIARPHNFNIRKEVLANSLKYAPYWDPLFISPEMRGVSDSVLEARPELWHVDRVTHEVTISNIVTGEDGTEVFTNSEITAGSVSIQIEGRPLRAVTINADVGWTQPAKGVVTLYDGAVIDSFSGDGIISDWPKADSNVGGGWNVAVSSAINVPDYTVAYNKDRWTFYGTPPQVVLYNSEIEPGPDVTLGESIEVPDPNGGPSHIGTGFLNIPKIPSDWIEFPIYDGPFVFATWKEKILVPMWHAKVSLQLGYEAERKRSERLLFTLRSDVQSIITLADEEESPVISLSSSPVDEPASLYEPVDLPIGDPTRRSYFPTDRGLESVEYLLSYARSRLLMGARVIKVTCQVPFESAMNLTLRMSGTINSPDLPAGTATGKIVTYAFSCDGSSGELIGSVTIACTIGKGSTILASDGDADIVEEDCVEHDLQTHTNEIVLIDGSDVGYSVPSDDVNDDGLILTRPLRKEEVVITENFANVAGLQKQIIRTQINENLAAEARERLLNPWSGFEDGGTVVSSSTTTEVSRVVIGPHGLDPDTLKATQDQIKAIIEQHSSLLTLTLKPVDGGPYLTEYGLHVTDLAVRKGIDLEVCS